LSLLSTLTDKPSITSISSSLPFTPSSPRPHFWVSSQPSFIPSTPDLLPRLVPNPILPEFLNRSRRYYPPQVVPNPHRRVALSLDILCIITNDVFTLELVHYPSSPIQLAELTPSKSLHNVKGYQKVMAGGVEVQGRVSAYEETGLVSALRVGWDWMDNGRARELYPVPRPPLP
jgi:hypothetical protein